MQIRNMFKIHGLRTANGQNRSANTPKFYETERDALEAAENMMCGRPPFGCPTDSLVIYKAWRVVRPLCAPVEVLDIEDDGHVIQIPR